MEVGVRSPIGVLKQAFSKRHAKEMGDTMSAIAGLGPSHMPLGIASGYDNGGQYIDDSYACGDSAGFIEDLEESDDEPPQYHPFLPMQVPTGMSDTGPAASMRNSTNIRRLPRKTRVVTGSGVSSTTHRGDVPNAPHPINLPAMSSAGSVMGFGMGLAPI